MSISIFEYNEAEEKEKLRKAEYQGGYDRGYFYFKIIGEFRLSL